MNTASHTPPDGLLEQLVDRGFGSGRERRELGLAGAAVRQLADILQGPASRYTVDAAISACARKVVAYFDQEDQRLQNVGGENRTRHRRMHRELLRRLAEGWMAHRLHGVDVDGKLQRVLRALARHFRVDRCSAS